MKIPLECKNEREREQEREIKPDGMLLLEMDHSEAGS